MTRKRIIAIPSILLIALLLTSTASAQSVWIYRIFGVGSPGTQVWYAGWDTYDGWYGGLFPTPAFPSPLPGAPMSSVSVSAGDTSLEYLFYVATNGQIVSVFGSTKAMGGWVHETDAFYSCGRSLASGKWTLTSLMVQGGPHVYFIDTNGHIIDVLPYVKWNGMQ